MPAPVNDYHDEMRGWAVAVLSALGERTGLSGGFASKLADAALRADDRNLSYVGEGFPLLVEAVEAYRTYGYDYLVALAYGDEGRLVAAYEAWQDREVSHV